MIAYGIFSKTYCEVVLNSRIRLLLFQHMTYFLLEYLMIDNTETERKHYVEEMFDLLVKEEDEENMKLYKLMAYIVSILKFKKKELPSATDDLHIKKLYPSKAEKPMIEFGNEEKEDYLKKLEKYMKDYRKMIK